MKERFKNERNDKVANWKGISPVSLFLERSKDSRFVRFPKADWIEPVRALPERLRMWSDVRSAIPSGIPPSSLLFEKSMLVKMVPTFMSSRSSPLLDSHNLLVIYVADTGVEF